MFRLYKHTKLMGYLLAYIWSPYIKPNKLKKLILCDTCMIKERKISSILHWPKKAPKASHTFLYHGLSDFRVYGLKIDTKDKINPVTTMDIAVAIQELGWNGRNIRNIRPVVSSDFLIIIPTPSSWNGVKKSITVSLAAVTVNGPIPTSAS